MSQTRSNALFSFLCSFSGSTLFPNCAPESAPQYLENASCNVRGVTSTGVDLLLAMMNKGMLIDIDHMSNASLDTTLSIAENFGYPLVASHGLFFDLHERLYEDTTVPFTGALGRHERMRTRQQLERMKAVGSLVAVMTMDDVQILAGDPAGTPTSLPTPREGAQYGKKLSKFYVPRPDTPLAMPIIPDDCRHSTKSFAQAYSYAVDVMGGSVALGSDFNGVAQHLGARFGSQGCGGEDPGTVQPDLFRHMERAAQERAHNGVLYPFTNEFGTFSRPVIGMKTFDYNTDGLAHVGLLPDMLEDLKQIGFSDQQLDPLLTSAEQYIRTWERARGDLTCVPEPGTIPALVAGWVGLVGLARRHDRDSARSTGRTPRSSNASTRRSTKT